MMAWVVATQGPEILGYLLLVVLGCAYLGYIVHASPLLLFLCQARLRASARFTFFEKASRPR